MAMDKLIPMCKLRPISMDKAKGFTMAELLVTAAILSFVLLVVFGLLAAAQSSFFTMDTGTDLRNNLRLSAEKIASELRNTGYQSASAQFTILDGSGTNNSDIIRFSIPVLCSAASTLLDANGNPSYWGAPLSWGCNTYTCMDANADCSTLEYKYVQYSINASNQLERKILNTAFNTVANSTTIVGNDISDMQITQSADTHVISFVLTGLKKSQTSRMVTVTFSQDVLLNNLGG